MFLEPDVISRVHTDFSSADVDCVIIELNARTMSSRLIRCILVAAEGSLERFRELVQLADLDDRDVIVAGEYDLGMRRIRNLSESFLINSPLDFWIEAIAVVAYRHGFRLTELTSQPSTDGPFDDSSERCEGKAIFSNGISTVTIQKQGRQWSLHDHECDLRPYLLEAPVTDAERFQIRLDNYLSQK